MARDRSSPSLSDVKTRRRRGGAAQLQRWTHPSVVNLLAVTGETDPVEAITVRVRQIVVGAVDAGWTGPPFDPLRLADHLKIDAVAKADVADAQTVCASSRKPRIEFNPNRPHARVRYSIAHEIAHTLFPDWMDEVRERNDQHRSGDLWQLEALCNIAAAEILMPFGALAISDAETTIERLLTLRKEFDVSTEALLIRVAHLSDQPVAMFCASFRDAPNLPGRYRIDYVIGSSSWERRIPRGTQLPADTRLRECSAIGYTTAGEESWGSAESRFSFEAVGLAPYPGSSHPRVVGLLRRPTSAGDSEPLLRFVRGDATRPHGTGRRVLVQIVNDRTPHWGGGGFAQAVRRTWPAVQSDFVEWANHERLSLGKVHFTDVENGLSVASIVGQRGYGPSSTPRIRYSAVKAGLEKIVAQAKSASATLHMPRIGTGNAGGSWQIIEDIIRWTCCQAGVPVCVYDLPGATLPITEPTPGILFG